MGIRIDPEGNELVGLCNATDFRGRKVLEVGCGDGRLTFRYAHWAKRVHAIDPEKSLIAAARENTPPELRSRVKFQAAGIEHIKLAPAQFDICLLAWSL
jgi:ubiquinone/menaquinone biosynthesis C-methylase UbiE